MPALPCLALPAVSRLPRRATHRPRAHPARPAPPACPAWPARRCHSRCCCCCCCSRAPAGRWTWPTTPMTWGKTTTRSLSTTKTPARRVSASAGVPLIPSPPHHPLSGARRAGARGRRAGAQAALGSGVGWGEDSPVWEAGSCLVGNAVGEQKSEGYREGKFGGLCVLKFWLPLVAAACGCLRSLARIPPGNLHPGDPWSREKAAGEQAVSSAGNFSGQILLRASARAAFSLLPCLLCSGALVLSSPAVPWDAPPWGGGGGSATYLAWCCSEDPHLQEEESCSRGLPLSCGPNGNSFLGTQQRTDVKAIKNLALEDGWWWW